MAARTEKSDVPIQPVEKPILCNPYVEPADHWVYDQQTGEAKHGGMRRPAGYWYKTERAYTGQRRLIAEEDREDLPLVNALREDVRRWRESGYRGATNVTRDLLLHWSRHDLVRRLFFCQREAVETVIYLAELRIPGRSRRTGFQNFALCEEDLRKLLAGEQPGFPTARADFFPTLIDRPAAADLRPLVRMACKMATGSGKTVVMAMLVSWAFCNRGMNPASREFPNGVLVVCPNLTVKERLQVLRPENPCNYYEFFDLVPSKYRLLLNMGKVLVTNWHGFAPESEHSENGKSYAVVRKGEETGEAFARRVLGDLYDRMPIMVLNDEGHHCWRPAPLEEKLDRDEASDVKAELEEATVWIDGLDRINSAGQDGKPGILFCADTSATPFYIHGSGHPEGFPFPWIVSDFGLVDAIESGIVKIPRLPVSDTTGRPEAKYFRLWDAIDDAIQPGERLPGKARKPKPEVVYREAEAALKQIAGQWVERFQYIQNAKPGQDMIPPVLIIVCDNTDIAEVFYRKISGEREEEIVTKEDVEEAAEAEDSGEEDEAPGSRRQRRRGPKRRTIYEQGSVFPEFFANTPAEKRTIRIDTKLLAEAEAGDTGKTKQTFAEELRRVVATVGKPGLPGERVRCVVSVGMLTEGWDASNVTHVLGIRAFRSQLLCEQVVGRGLRRMDYTPDPKTGMLTEEYVDVYGIPFSVIPFKGRPTGKTEVDDRPKNHVKAMEERKEMEFRFPVVEGYAFALRRNLIKCDVGAIDELVIEPNQEPTATFLLPTVGYQVGTPSRSSPFPYQRQDRARYYAQTHLQTIEFGIARLIVDRLTSATPGTGDAKQRVLRLQSRHQLFPQVFRFVNEYVSSGRVIFGEVNHCELGLEKYVERTVERLCDAIQPNDEEGEPPLLPVLNRYKPVGTTAEVDFKTVRACSGTQRSHINQVVLDAERWESTAAFRLEEAALAGAVAFYARNDHLGLTIPYEYQGVDHAYEPDFLVRLANGLTVVLEIKGYEDDETKAKHTAAKRWVSSVNNWGQLGRWAFHVCRAPQQLGRELEHVARNAPVVESHGSS